MFSLTLFLPFIFLLQCTVLSTSTGSKSRHGLDRWVSSPVNEPEATLLGRPVAVRSSSRSMHLVKHGEGTPSVVQPPSVDTFATPREDNQESLVALVERKRKVRSDKGKPRAPWSEERRKKATMESNQERGQKISEAKRGKPWTQARRDAERQMTLDGRAKARVERMREARRGKKWTGKQREGRERSLQTGAGV